MDEEIVTEDAPLESDSERADRLEGELSTLRAEMAEREAQNSRMLSEYEEFSELFPNVGLETLSDGVWESVKRGVPLAAAYALYDRKNEISALRARNANEKNRVSSAGAVTGGGGEEYYSPEEVRAMSKDEVSANFDKIMASMKKWK